MKKYLYFAALAALFLTCFGCAYYLDTEEVRILSYSPSDTYVSGEQVKVEFDFSASMDCRSTEGAFTFTENGQKKPGRFIWSDKCRKLTFIPADKCFLGKQYGFTLLASAESENGNDLEGDINHAFLLGTDTVRPFVEQTLCSPQPGTRLTPDKKREPVIITFSEAMLKPYPFEHVSISPPIEGTWEWLDEAGNSVDQFSDIPSRVLRFTPFYDYINRQSYQVSVRQTITDESNNTLHQSYSFSFYMNEDGNTLDVLSVTAGAIPLVNAADTYQLSTGVEKNDVIRVTFTNPMEKDVTVNRLKIVPAKQVYYTWLSDTELEISLDDKDSYLWDTEYCLTIDRNVTDVYGNNLLTDYSYHFKITGPLSAPPVLQKITSTCAPTVDLLQNHQLTPYIFDCTSLWVPAIGHGRPIESYVNNFFFKIEFAPGHDIDINSFADNIIIQDLGPAQMRLVQVQRESPGVFNVEVRVHYGLIYYGMPNHISAAIIMIFKGRTDNGGVVEGIKDMNGNYMEESKTINMKIIRQS